MENLESKLATLMKSEADKPFAAALGEKLIAEMENRKNKSFLTHLFSRTSFAYIAGISLMAFLVYILFLGQSIPGEDMIKRAEAYYGSELEDGKIYYEKSYVEQSKFSGTDEYSTWEVWYNKQGDYLQVEKKDDTVISAQMYLVDEYGQVASYEIAGDPVSESFSAGITNENGEEVNSETWQCYNGDVSSCFRMDIHAMPEYKTYCVDVKKDENYTSQAVLMVGDDPLNYVVNGMSFSSEEDSGDQVAEDLSAAKTNAGVAKALLSQLKTEDDYTYEEQEKYFVFSLTQAASAIDGGDADIEYRYYFNKETSLLEIEELYSNSEDHFISRTTYLDFQTLDESEKDAIFTTENYNLEQIPAIQAGQPLLMETGCYDSTLIRLSDEEEQKVWDSLPASAIEEFNNLVDGVPEGNSEIASFSGAIGEESGIHDNSLTQKVVDNTDCTSIITAYFASGHYAIDIACEDDTAVNPNILTPISGEIIDVQYGWNGGYGTTVRMSGDDGAEILYAHLNEVLVEIGDKVTEGEVVGTMGNTGRVYGESGIHLHLEVVLDGVKIDPLGYLQAHAD